jgi:hypothetical protein
MNSEIREEIERFIKIALAKRRRLLALLILFSVKKRAQREARDTFAYL